MGLFLETAIIKGRGLFPVNSNDYGIVPEKCIMAANKAGTTLQFNEDTTGFEKLAADLSREANGTVLLCYIYDDDFWGYSLYDRGQEKDVFCPIPDYFGDVDEKDVLKMAGNAEVLSEVFNISGRIWKEMRMKRHIQMTSMVMIHGRCTIL